MQWARRREQRHRQQTSFVIGAKSEHLAQRTTPCACQAYRDPSYPLRNSIEDGTGARERSKGTGAWRQKVRTPTAAKREGGEWEGGGERGGEGGGEGAGGGRRSGGRGTALAGEIQKSPISHECPITSGIIQCCKIISFFSHSKILKFLTPPFPSKK